MRSPLPITLSLAFSCSLAAAARPQTQIPPGTFPSEVEVVNVDVVVLDEHGNPAEGLTAADFVVKEDGRPQSVSSFEALGLSESLPAARLGTVRVSTNSGPRDPAARWFIVVFDDANLSQHSTPRAREAILGFLREGLRPGDQVMIVPASGAAWWTGRLPEDAESLAAFVERLQGTRRPDPTPGRIWDHEAIIIANDRDPKVLGQVARRYFENGLIPEAYPADRDVARDLDVSPGLPLIRSKAREAYAEAAGRLRMTLETLERVSASLTQLKGRKTVLLVSEGFIMDPTESEFRELLRAARRANAAVHFIDARSPEGLLGQAGMAGGGAEFGAAVEERDTTTMLAFAGREAEGARSVALDTGGSIVSGTARLAEGMAKIARESRAYYLLGYVSTNAKRDGKFRKIEVAVARPGVEVRARRGYYAPSDKEERRPRPDALDPAVRAALDAPSASAGIPLRLTSYVFGPQGKEQVATILVAEADVTSLGLKPRDGKYSAALDSYVLVHGRDSGEVEKQETLVELAIPAEAYEKGAGSAIPIRREFALPPGHYQARLLLRDRATGRLGSVRHEFEVAPPGELRVSTPMLTDSARPAEGGPPRPIPVAHRTFRAGSSIACAFEVYGAAPDAVRGGPRVSVAYRLVGPDGKEVSGSPPRPLAPGPLGQLSQVLVLSLPAGTEGQHELLLTLRDEVAVRILEVSEPFVVSRQ